MLLLLPGRLVSCKGPKLFKNKLAQGSEASQKQIGARVRNFSKTNWRKGPKLLKNKLVQGSETFQRQIGARVRNFSKTNWRKGPKLLQTKLAPSPNSRLHQGDSKKQVVFFRRPTNSGRRCTERSRTDDRAPRIFAAPV
jgi:hypothetical protein